MPPAFSPLCPFQPAKHQKSQQTKIINRPTIIRNRSLGVVPEALGRGSEGFLDSEREANVFAERPAALYPLGKWCEDRTDCTGGCQKCACMHRVVGACLWQEALTERPPLRVILQNKRTKQQTYRALRGLGPVHLRLLHQTAAEQAGKKRT